MQAESISKYSLIFYDLASKQSYTCTSSFAHGNHVRLQHSKREQRTNAYIYYIRFGVDAKSLVAKKHQIHIHKTNVQYYQSFFTP